MSQKGLTQIARLLASDYPSVDKPSTAQEFQAVLEIVLPLLAKRASLIASKDTKSATEMWQLIREDSEGLFEEALAKVERLKVIFVASKFMNNKLIGEMMTKQALEIASRRKEN